METLITLLAGIPIVGGVLAAGWRVGIKLERMENARVDGDAKLDERLGAIEVLINGELKNNGGHSLKDHIVENNAMLRRLLLKEDKSE